MIDQIKIVTSETRDGRKFEQVRVWIAGIPFHADNSEYVERIMHRVARELEQEIVDLRKGGR